jgi:hypothetical protein
MVVPIDCGECASSVMKTAPEFAAHFSRIALWWLALGGWARVALAIMKCVYKIAGWDWGTDEPVDHPYGRMWSRVGVRSLEGERNRAEFLRAMRARRKSSYPSRSMRLDG